MSEKRKWPRAEALKVAAAICAALSPDCCERALVAGSIRRRKAMVGDVEIVFIPRFVSALTSEDMFTAPKSVSLADIELARLISIGTLTKRKNVKGAAMWGEENKLAVHVASGIPVDLFVTTVENWWNYLVCRTGGEENNVAIASAAKRRGWKWNSYGSGFSRGGPLAGEMEKHVVTSEREVFDFVGLPYLEPEQRR